MEMSKHTNTSSPGNEAEQTTRSQAAIVRYDGACSLCKTLAEFMGRKVPPESMIFLPSEKETPEKLEVEIWDDGQKVTLAGEYAWDWILAHHPYLDEIHWIAEKMGIHTQTSRYMMQGAELLRRFCFRCRR